MRRLFLLSLLFLIGCTNHQSTGNREASVDTRSQTNCTLSAEKRDQLLELDYKAFDQTLPDGGWRGLNSCSLVARDLIDAYLNKRDSSLKTDEVRTLIWHSGQLAADAGEYMDAASRMARTLRGDEKPGAAFQWNAYVRASIAFLNRSRETLEIERELLAQGLSPLNRLNVRTVDRLIRCFDSSYHDAYSGRCDSPETAIDRIRASAIPIWPGERLPLGLFELGDFLAQKKVLFVGEVHGTHEVPQFFAGLVKTVASEERKTLVALEIDQSSQKAVDEFLESGDATALKRDPFFKRADQDGRSSVATIALLRKLAKLPGVTVVCMDPASSDRRDNGMAKFLNERRAGFDRVLVLAGNLHTRLSIGYEGDAGYRPLGYEFKQIAKDLGDADVMSLRMRYGTLNAWTCMNDGCKARYGEPIATPYSEAVPYDSYFVLEDGLADGHNASIFLRRTAVAVPL